MLYSLFFIPHSSFFVRYYLFIIYYLLFIVHYSSFMIYLFLILHHSFPSFQTIIHYTGYLFGFANFRPDEMITFDEISK